MTPGEAFTIL
jgi:hypothetical protein